MVAYAGQAILHGIIAALFVEALLRLWRVREPDERLALRWLALAAPLLVTPIYSLAAPVRATGSFGVRWALFSGHHWDQLRLGGTDLTTFVTLVSMGLGLLLFLRDVVPYLHDRMRTTAETRVTDPGDPRLARLRRVLALIPDSLSIGADVVLIDRDGPVLLCSAAGRRPSVLASTGALARLDDAELRAALSHEVSHLVRHDPQAGWVLLLLRTLQIFSPAAQIVGRHIVQELEYRADMAVAREGHSAELVRAIAQLSQADPALSNPERRARPEFRRRLVAHTRRLAEEARRRRLEEAAPATRSVAPICAVLAAAGLALLLFFVV